MNYVSNWYCLDLLSCLPLDLLNFITTMGQDRFNSMEIKYNFFNAEFLTSEMKNNYFIILVDNCREKRSFIKVINDISVWLKSNVSLQVARVASPHYSQHWKSRVCCAFRASPENSINLRITHLSCYFFLFWPLHCLVIGLHVCGMRLAWMARATRAYQ